MKHRTRCREAALKICFMCDFIGDWSEGCISGAFVQFDTPSHVEPYAKVLALGAGQDLEIIDSLLTQASHNWSVSRMARVERALLRIAVYEMIRVPEVSVFVVINEIVELSKLYCAPDAPHFINGVLDRVAHLDATTVYLKNLGKVVPSNEREARNNGHLSAQRSSKLVA